MYHSQKAAGRFIVARGQSSKLLEATKKAFDFIAVAVKISVNHPLDKAVFFAWNHGLGTHSGHTGKYSVRVLGFVSQHVACACGGRQQVGCTPAIGLLAGAEYHAQRVAQRVDYGVDFSRQPTATAPKGFVAYTAFFWLPAACAWARTTVESSITQSRSGSCTASNRRCQIPFWAQRRLRLRNVSCLPKRAGSARQAHPWRATQSTALINSRLSTPVRPTSPALPDKCGAKAAHARSLISSKLFTNTKVIVRAT